jgi:hypothetical protein
MPKEKKCKVVLSQNISKTYEIPIDSPINGAQKIREDIEVKGGIVEMSVLSTNEKLDETGLIYSKNFTGPYLISSQGDVKEGGESGNPNKLITTTILGVM